MTMATVQVANKAQADLLLNERYAEVLGVLAGRNATALEVAQAVSKPLSSVHTQLQTLMEAEVITLHAQRPRAGRAMKEYHLPLPWNIPFAVTPAVSLRDLLTGRLEGAIQQQMGALAGSLERVYDSADWVVHVHAVPGGLSQLVRNEALGKVATQPFLGVSTALSLTPDRAVLLRSRLEEVLNEFRGEIDQESGTTQWGLLILLTPP